MEFVDTHCHIHFDDYGLDPDQVIQDAIKDGVTRLVCVGCTYEDSKNGVAFAQKREGVWASIGLHPHEAHHYVSDTSTQQAFKKLASQAGVVAIGECGLDYYYNHSPKNAQIAMLEFQLQLAKDNNLPVIFHVRDAFDDFWPILDNFPGLRGVVHSFTATMPVLEQVINRGLYIGLNGIMTFTKDHNQLIMAKSAPLESIVLETDAPFLTPTPFRGTICESKHVRVTAEFLSELRGETLELFATTTTSNARNLFNLV